MGATNAKEELEPEELDKLKEQINMDESDIIELYNGFLKECPNGKMNQQQLCQMYKQIFPNGNPKTFSKHLFRSFDLDKNGYVDFSEFLLAINITSSASVEEKIRWAFKIYDIDGNGYISKNEFTNVIKSIYKMLKNRDLQKSGCDIKEKCETVFIQLDTDGDDRVTFEEFEQLCLENVELKSLLVPEIAPESSR